MATETIVAAKRAPIAAARFSGIRGLRNRG
jgi:hypothetical protein